MPTESTYGSCTAALPGNPLASVDVQVSALDMMVHWGRCSLTADFLAEFIAPSFADSDGARVEISIILDELIENAVKFCASVEEPVAVTVDNYDSVIRVQVSNLCKKEHADDLGAAISEVLRNNPEELFVRTVEFAAVEDELSSRLGFITLSMHDAVRLGARISKASVDGLHSVTVQVVIERDGMPALGPTSGDGVA